MNTAREQSPLFILAFDHRASLERQLYGLSAAPTALEAARISADKVLVYQALLDAAARMSPGAQPGILVDEQYGASVAELASRSGEINLSMPIEASGHDRFEFAYSGDWQQHARFFGADHAKVLVRDHPSLDAVGREIQADRLAQVSEWAAASDRPLILELLVPATQADLALVDGDAYRYDTELRTERTLAVIAFLQNRGIAPSIWKVEGLDRAEDARSIVAAVRRGGRSASAIVLGRHAAVSRINHWLKIAASTPGFVGFAIGRTIWWDALKALLLGQCDSAEARNRIAKQYLGFASAYIESTTGG